MAGYSGTPLAKKLGIRSGAHIAVVQAPRGWKLITPGVTQLPNMRGRQALDVVLFFTRREAELRRRFERLAARLTPAGGLWIAWPKQASGQPTDLSFVKVQQIGLAAGLVDNKICAINDTWSGLRFVRPKKDR